MNLSTLTKQSPGCGYGLPFAFSVCWSSFWRVGDPGMSRCCRRPRRGSRGDGTTEAGTFMVLRGRDGFCPGEIRAFCEDRAGSIDSTELCLSSFAVLALPPLPGLLQTRRRVPHIWCCGRRGWMLFGMREHPSTPRDTTQQRCRLCPAQRHRQMVVGWCQKGPEPLAVSSAGRGLSTLGTHGLFSERSSLSRSCSVFLFPSADGHQFWITSWFLSAESSLV